MQMNKRKQKEVYVQVSVGARSLTEITWNGMHCRSCSSLCTSGYALGEIGGWVRLYVLPASDGPACGCCGETSQGRSYLACA